MHARFSAALLAATMGAAGLLSSAGAQAALVGHQTNCVYYNQGDTAAMIVASGHTPVAVATVDATSLSGLAAFVYEQCWVGGYVSGAAIDAAVANGMVLVTHPWTSSVVLPGSVSPGAIGGQTPMVLPVGSPALAGPAGALSTARSYLSYPQAFFERSTLPQDSTIVATSDSRSDYVVAFAYDYGRGRVVASTVPLNYFLINGSGLWEVDAANIRTYASNLVAWAVGPRFSSCAAEGYAGAKLTLCRQVCEIDQTPSRLLSLIKLYKAIYRVDPPCAL